jgi:putative ABC transport system permease protein
MAKPRSSALVLGVSQDVRFGLRSLWRRPGFTAVATLTLALGIGANTAIFSIVDAVLIRPMPYQDADRLVVLWEANPLLGMPFMNVAPPTFSDWKARARSLEVMGVWREQSFTISTRGVAEHIDGAALSHEMFDVLKVRPAIGRLFTSDEDVNDGAHVSVISDRLWRGVFGAAPGVVGRTLLVDGVLREIVGVMPATFTFPPPVAFEGIVAPKVNDIWIPLGLGGTTGQRGAHYLLSLGRLRPGVTAEAAERELVGIAEQIARDHPDTNTGWTVRVVPFDRQVTGDQRPALVALAVAVGLVLLLACANVASLVLARGMARRREIAIRGALGATRTRIARQLLIESLLLSAIGTVAGFVLAGWIVRAVRSFGGTLLPRLAEAALDERSLAFAIVLCLAAAVIFGMAPAFHVSRSDSAEWLKDRIGAPRTGRLQSVLVIVELALSVILLTGAALLGESVYRLLATDPGFRADRTLTARLTLPPSRYPGRSDRAAFLDRVLATIRATGGIISAGAIDAAPLADDRQGTGFTIDGETPTPEIRDANVNFSFTTPGYFAAMGIITVRGRDFSDTDRSDSTPVIVINQEMARRYFSGRNPIGMRIRAGFNTNTAREIIGIVGDERHISLDRPAPPGMYTPFAQVGWSSRLTLIARTSTNAGDAAAVMREAVRTVDPQIALYDIKSLEQIVIASVGRPRFSAALLALFAATALLLSAVGVYGVISQVVGQRTQEFGVRIALGAKPVDLVWLVIGFGLRLTVAGVLIGVPAAFAFSRVLRGLLYGVTATDPWTYTAVVVALAVTALLAAALPARRATKLDPLVALRAE